MVEQTAILPTRRTEIFWRTHHWTWLVLAIEKGVPTAFIIGVAGAMVFSWETFRNALRSLVEESGAVGFKWLLIHLAVVAALLGWTALCRANRIFPSPYWEIWMWVRVALELLALASWAAAALPPSFWLRWFAASPRAFVAGAACALLTKMLGHYTEALWLLSLFQSSTLLTVAALLRLCGQFVITGPAAQIGTPAFSVEVGSGCSGLQGFGVMVTFLAIYFWAYRRDLRFPQVLLLVPVGLALQWFLNSIRIAVLILLGTWNQAAAVNGFHSIAGWLFVSFVAYGVVSASWRVPAFTKIGSEAEGSSTLESCRSVPRAAPRDHRDCDGHEDFLRRIRFALSSAGICRRGCLVFLSAGARRLYDGVHPFGRLHWVCSFSRCGSLWHHRMTPRSTQLLPRASAGYRPGEGRLGFSSE